MKEKSFYLTKYARYYENTFSYNYYPYVFQRLCKSVGWQIGAKIMRGYFKSFYAYHRAFERIKYITNFKEFNIDFSEIYSSAKNHKFKKVKYKKKILVKKHLFKLTPKIKALHDKEMYEHYCDCREAKTGYRNTFGNPKTTENVVKSNLKKYGVRSTAMLSWVKEKQAQTNLEKYGQKSPLCDPKIRAKRGTKGTRNSKKKFDYTPSKEIFESFIIDNRFDMRGCSKFFGLSKSEILKYLKEFKIKIPIYYHRERTQIEFFNSIQVESKTFNTRTVIPPFELDIFLPDANLAIEYNGLLYHSQGISSFSPINNPTFDKNYHLSKTLLCAAKDIQLFHIFEGENLDLWLSMVHNKLGVNKKIFARKCNILEISQNDAKEFFKENHLQGSVNSLIQIGLYFGGILVSAMSFGRPRFTKKYEYELLRFCTLKNHNVIGGASKLWKYFLKKYAPKSVVSYANLRFSNGAIYEKLGFSKIGQSAPNYFYFDQSLKLESRLKYQKHKLQKYYESGELEYYNPAESEIQNMLKNGYRRIFDCGNLIYEFKNI